jgi:hypothetical protein
VALLVDRHRKRRIAAAAVLALLVSAAVFGLGGILVPARAAEVGVGAGIFSVDGDLVQNLSLPLGGTYYLSVAPEGPSAFVNASLSYNGSLLAQENASSSSSNVASLPAGNYSLALAGRGRAALGWDFTNGTTKGFPDNATLVAFLAPSGPRVDVTVSLGDAQRLELTIYGDDLLPIENASVSADGPVTFVLPSSATHVAYLVTQATAGLPNGLYGLSWTSGPVNPPLDFTAWPLFLLWILVPVAVALAVFVLLHRRRARG